MAQKVAVRSSAVPKIQWSSNPTAPFGYYRLWKTFYPLSGYIHVQAKGGSLTHPVFCHYLTDDPVGT